MSLYKLDYNQFTKQGNQLLVALDGPTLVMFTTSNCVYCKQFEGEFQMLPNSFNTVNFAICSLDGPNRQIAQMSQDTTAPITKVPLFIFYNNGVPVSVYQGQRNFSEISKFIQEMITRYQGSFARPPRPQQPQQPQAPMQQPQMPQAPMQQPQMPQAPMQQQQQTPKYTINPSSGVKEYETSYGLPHNAVNEAEFLNYEADAYKSSR